MADEINKRDYSIDMTEGKVLKKMLAFSFPLMASGMLQLLFNMVDMVIVGRFAGDICLAAVGATTALSHLVTNTLIGLSIGANVVIAKAIGSKDLSLVKESVYNSIIVALLSGVVMGAVGIGLRTTILTTMGTPELVLPYSEKYITIIFFGSPMVALFNFCASALKAKGDTRHPLQYLIISGIINLILNLIFVIVFKLDVRGVALATIISQTISAVLVLNCMLKEKMFYEKGAGTRKLNGEIMADILKIGVPASVQGILVSLSNMIVQSSVNKFGEVVVAGSAASNSVEHFIFASVNCFAQAGVSFAAQNLGANKIDRIPLVTGCTILCAFAGGLISGAGFYIFSDKVMALYSSTPEIVAEGVKRMMFICLPYCIFGIMDSFSGILRGMGHAVIPAVSVLAGTCLFRALWIFGLNFSGFDYTVEYVYMAFPLSWTITIAINAICYSRVLKKLRADYHKKTQNCS